MMMLQPNQTSIAEHAGLTTRLKVQPPHLIRSSISCVCLLCPFVLPKIPSKSTPAHHTAVGALSRRPHLIPVDAGPIQLANGFATDAIHHRILLHYFFCRLFRVMKIIQIHVLSHHNESIRTKQQSST